MRPSKRVRSGCGRDVHPGVQLRPPRAKNPRWAARYRDAETGAVKDIRLSPEQAQSAATRTAFAIELSQQLRGREAEIVGGALPHEAADQPIQEALARYFKAKHGNRDRTREDYLEASDRFVRWCRQHRVQTVRQIKRATLRAFREACCEDGLSPYTVNSRLTRTGVLLRWLIEEEVLRLHLDDVQLGLKKLPTDTITRRPFLSAQSIHALLGAALRHDSQRFKATRAGLQSPKYQPISGFLRFALLTGLRPGESIALTWDRVHLDRREIWVHPSQGKRRIDRIVDLDVCPSVHTLLKLMRRNATEERVWAMHTKHTLDDTLDRLRADPQCPPFDYQTLRVTAATYLACMPSFGPVQESRQLGHSITTAEKFYVGRVRIPLEVKTLEGAYGI